VNRDDPFGLESDAGRTRIRPAARDGQAPAHRPVTGAAAQAGPRIRQSRANENPLIASFSALLSVAPELERASAPANPEVLRSRLLDNLIYSRDGAVAQGVPLARADAAAWLVAALLDDLALNTPWGGASDWPRQPLVVSHAGHVDAGDRFFDRVDELLRFPERDPELLELAFMCLALGFRGKHRAAGSAGEGILAQLRAQIARVLRKDEPPLAPHWRGVIAPDRKPRFAVPLWSIALVAAVLIAAIYVGLGVRLSERGEQLYVLAGLLPPPERAAIYRPVRETAPPVELALESPMIELLPLIEAAAPSASRAAWRGREDVALTVLSVQANDPEVFRSARAELNDAYLPLIAAVGRTIADNLDLIGGVTVLGHTDSIPVQRSNPFASNQGLSEARARTVADRLVAAGVPRELVASEGRAASEPVADNSTAEGRARNRRVEIRIEKKV
jgi:type VI secretion system protein ImpK